MLWSVVWEPWNEHSQYSRFRKIARNRKDRIGFEQNYLNLDLPQEFVIVRGCDNIGNIVNVKSEIDWICLSLTTFPTIVRLEQRQIKLSNCVNKWLGSICDYDFITVVLIWNRFFEIWYIFAEQTVISMSRQSISGNM